VSTDFEFVTEDETRGEPCTIQLSLSEVIEELFSKFHDVCKEKGGRSGRRTT